LGLYPGVGELADLLNAGLYALEGDWANAAISGLGVVPILGDVAKTGRWVRRVRDASAVVLYERAGSKVLRAARPSEEVVCESLRAARREAMRRAGIPTCRQPIARRGTANNRQYEYAVPLPGGGMGRKVVTHHPADTNHPYPHWEASTPKRGGGIDPLGHLRYDNTDRISHKPKVNVPYRR